MKRLMLLVALSAGACRSSECIDRVSGIDTCELCLAKPISCSANEFTLTWGCHYPPSPNPTQRSCVPQPAPCAANPTCACLTASFDGGVNCSPSFGATCTADGGSLEIYCSPP